MMTADHDDYAIRVGATLKALGIPLALVEQRALEICCEPRELVIAQVDDDGREHRLTPAAEKAWREMSAAAKSAGEPMHIVSAFRSVERQMEIVRTKLAAGLSLDEILCVSAPPGYSEHHTGRAVDVNAQGLPLAAEFEKTTAFEWLVKHADRFGFVMSYPRQNRFGFVYEPWHWFFSGNGA
jgi:D-alanyl-D-alanine carboxypeptidase